MPGEHRFVDSFNGRGCVESNEQLRGLLFEQVVINDDGYFEVLADDTHDGAKGRGELPVDFVVEHVEEDDGLVPDANLVVTQQLNKQLLYQLQLLPVVRDLCKQQRPLQLLQQLLRLWDLTAPEVTHHALVYLLCENILVQVNTHFLYKVCQTLQSLQLY